MLKKIFLIGLLVLMLATTVHSAFTTSISNRKTYKNAYRWTGKPKDLLLDWAEEVEDRMDGTTGNEFVFFLPTTAPSATTGNLYFDLSLDALVVRTSSGFETLEAGGDFASLDEAYNGGAAITVDNGAVTLTAPNANDNTAFAIVQADTGTAVGMTLTNAGTGNTIDIQNNQAGTDIEGTDDKWNVATTGVGTFLSFALENGETIKNDTNNEIEFGVPSGEDVSFNFATSNTVTLTTDSGLDSFAFGVVDDLEGVGTIVFDEAAGSISLAGTTNAFDLTIAQTGTVDSSLILTSAGSISDALSLITTDGVGSIKINSADNIDIDAADNITIDTAGGSITTTLIGGDFALDATDASITLDAGEAATDAIVLVAAAGGIDADTALSISFKSTENTADAIELVATAGGIDITSAGGAAEDIDIVSTSGSVNISAGENNSAAMVLSQAGGTSGAINIFADNGTGASATTEHDASVQLHSDDGGISLYTTADIADAVRIETNGGVDEFITINNLQGTGSDAITISANAAAGNVNILSVLGSIRLLAEEDAADAILLQVDGVNSTTMRLIATTGTSVTEDAAAIQLTATAGGIQLQSDAAIDGDVIVLRADGGVTNDILIHNDQGTGIDCIDLQADAGGILLTAAKPVSVTNAFETDIVVLPTTTPITILANNSGQVHLMPDTVQDTTINLPAEADNLHYEFWYVGAVADAHDWIITSGDDLEQFVGGVVHHDVDGELVNVVYSDGNSNSKLGVLTPEAGTKIELRYDLATTSWYINGTVISATNTAVTFADQ